MNIVLIGMPGSGKSTVGVLLAKSLLMDFVDTDLVLQNRYNQSLCDMIERYGIDSFKTIENDILSELKFKNTVIATGGSAVYASDGMKNLKRDAIVVYLKVSPETVVSRINNITTRGIVMDKDMTVSDLYAQRKPLYETYADIVVECDFLTPEECVNAIIKERS